VVSDGGGGGDSGGGDDGDGGSGGGGGGGDRGVRVCVVVLLGVLSMHRAAVIGKSIPDGTNQLALRSTVIRIRRLTVRHRRRRRRSRDGSSRESRVGEERERNEREREREKRSGVKKEIREYRGIVRAEISMGRNRCRFCSVEKEGVPRRVVRTNANI